MRVEPKAIVRRLNSTCTAMLEAAVAHAASGRYYEISPEHLMHALLAGGEDTDAAAILGHAGQDAGRLRQRLARVIELTRSGNAGRPVFSESLFQWIEDAWVYASLQLGATEVRSGHLLLMFASRGHRYTGETFPELAALPVEAIGKEFAAITDATREAIRAAPADDGKPATSGGGGGGGHSSGGDSALKRFTSSYTEKARAGRIDPVFGRHAEIRQLTEILARRRKNNPIIVGEAGVGKTALVEGLARAIAEGDVPAQLRDVELLELDMGLLQAGAGVRGEFEKRLKTVIDEVKASPRPIVLFIDEAHTIVGKEADAANLLKPALARGELRTIAATTWSEYKKYFEKDAAFARRFQPVKVDEPSEAAALVMLRGLRATYEAAHGVTIRDDALAAAASLSHRYIAGRQLPDKAVDLLDTAATRVRIEQDAKPEALVRGEQDVQATERELELLRREQAEGGPVDEARLADVEARLAGGRDALAGLGRRWQAERDALAAVVRAREAVRAGGGAAALADKRAADERLVLVGGDDRLIHAEVDVDVVAQVVATWTGIPVGKMQQTTLTTLLGLHDTLSARVRGQSDAVRVTAETLKIAAAQIHNQNAPLGVLLFVGPSGVGKTEMATALADLLYGGERFMTTINMSEFQEKHSVSRLIGSPPGYVGYGEGGVLTEAVRQRPYSVVLLDECEKADLEVMNLFYQVFDKGTLSDGEGRIVDFKNTVVILTSNLASDIISQQAAGDERPTAAALTAKIRPALSRHFKPALLARMTIVPFFPLPTDVLREIVELKLAALQRRIHGSHKIATEFAPELLAQLAQRCTESETGARTVDHILRGSLMPALSQRLLEQFAAGHQPSRLRVGIGGADAGWDIDLA
jgi:type VI secretion system protein VasG